MNILLILTDQQSADAMSCCCNPYLTTPNLDRLAARGVRFDRAYCTYPVCVPSRSSIFYGRMPSQLQTPGAQRIGGADVHDPKVGIKPEYRSEELAKLLSAGGYDCVYGGKWHVGKWGSTESLKADMPTGFGSICRLNDLALPDACRDYFDDRDDTPFFMVASFDNPHNICEWQVDAALPWGNLPMPPAVGDLPPLPPNFAPSPYEPPGIRELQQRCHDAQARSHEDWRRYRWAYYRLVETVDAQIGKLLDALDKHALWDDTLVIFTSDHGDMNAAHSLPQKGVFYNESVRVPFLVAGAPVAAATVRDELIINSLDIYATICDYANVPAPSGTLGASLRPLLEDAQAPEWRDHVIAEGAYHHTSHEARMVCTARYKYILYNHGPCAEQLFDLERDPGEMSNLAVCSQFRDILQLHRELLRTWLKQTGEQFRAGHYTHPDVPVMLPGDPYA